MLVQGCLGRQAPVSRSPYAPGFLATAPDSVREHLYAALGIECVYRPAMKQVTIRATITSSTPGIVAALLADPRTSGDNTSVSAGEATGLFDEPDTAGLAAKNGNIYESTAWPGIRYNQSRPSTSHISEAPH